MNQNITVKEAQRLKLDLEKTIAQYLYDYYKATGVVITNANLTWLEGAAIPVMQYQVKLEARL